MNSRTRLRFEAPDHSRAFSDYYTSKQLPDRASLTAAVTTVVILATLTFNLLRSPALTRRLHSLLHLLWNCAVALTPGALIHALDRLVNPPMFPGLPPPAAPRTHAEKRDKMAALLGANRAAGVIRSLSSGFPRPSFPSGTLGGGLLFGASKDQPAGLGNLDNSCYQNSILQGLASLDHLSPYLEGSLRGRPAGLETARTLRDLMSRLRDAENNGRTLWTPGVLKNMCSFQQQDAQEYYAKILDEIDKEISKAGTPAPGAEWGDAANDDTSLHSDDSGYSSASAASKVAPEAPRNPLEGLLAQRVACTQCGHSDGLSLIPFNCLTINLGLGTPGHDLYERLDAYTDLEAIEGVECPRCTLLKLRRLLRTLDERMAAAEGAADHRARVAERLGVVEAALEDETFDDETMRGKCKVTPENRANVIKTKQAVVARPPKSLAVHVNRSVFDERTGMLFKNPAAVQFPTTLDLGPWCLGSRAAPGAVDGAEEEAWGLGPRVSMVAGEHRPSLVSGPMYELRAVVTHFGHHNNGHYICYRKHASGTPPMLDEPEKVVGDDEVEEAEAEDGGPEETEGPTWWRLSDESVRKVPEDVVMAQGGVFMLFYDCVDAKLARTGGEAETLVEEESVAPSIDGTELSSAETVRGEEEGEGDGGTVGSNEDEVGPEVKLAPGHARPREDAKPAVSSEETPRSGQDGEDVRQAQSGSEEEELAANSPEPPMSDEEREDARPEVDLKEEPPAGSADTPTADEAETGDTEEPESSAPSPAGEQDGEVGGEVEEPAAASEPLVSDDTQRGELPVPNTAATPRAGGETDGDVGSASAPGDAKPAALDAADGELGTMHAGEG